jgi:spermidine/putrescine transport system permease protein
MKGSKASASSLTVLAAFTYFCLWMPVVILIVFSFTKDQYGTEWKGFTTRWYIEIVTNSQVRDALMCSLYIAIATVIVATLAGTFTAYGLYKYKFRGKKLFRMAILLPIIIPYVVTAGALLLYFSRIIYIPLGYISIIIAHISFSFPLAVFVVLGRMQRINWSLEEAAATLGANKLTVWRTITIPLLRPAIIASAVLIFPWSFNDFTITYFLAGLGTTTLPIYVFSQLRYGPSPAINTIGTIFVTLPFIMVFLIIFSKSNKVIKETYNN